MARPGGLLDSRPRGAIEMFVLIEYAGKLGRRTRLAVDGDAWVRQERREGEWFTAERHPVEDLRTVLGDQLDDAEKLTVEACADGGEDVDEPDRTCVYCGGGDDTYGDDTEWYERNCDGADAHRRCSPRP